MADELQQVGGWKAGVGEAAVHRIQRPIPLMANPKADQNGTNALSGTEIALA